MSLTTNATPKQFLDDDQISVRRLQTRGEKFLNDDLPQLGRLAIIGAQAALLAPLTGGLAVPLLAAAALTAGWAKFQSVYINAQFKNTGYGLKDPAYDLSNPSDRASFKNSFDRAQPGFVDDYLKLCSDAGFKSPPEIVMTNNGVASAHARQFGSADKNIVSIDYSAFSGLNRAELRTIMAHELTHLKLDHPNKVFKIGAVDLVSKAIGVTVATVALLSAALPLAPVALAAGGLYVLGKVISAAESRKQEKVADRGVNLLTGDSANLASAFRRLDEIRNQQRKGAGHKVSFPLKTIAYAVLPEKIAQKFLLSYRSIDRKLFSSHPTDNIRNELAEKFEQKYPVFCESRRGQFSGVFNRVAAPVMGQAPQSAFANTFKLQNKFKS